MARLKISAAAQILMATAGTILLPALSACHGRTLDNVEPTGETVEVAIDTLSRPTSAAGDTLLVCADDGGAERDATSAPHNTES